MSAADLLLPVLAAAIWLIGIGLVRKLCADLAAMQRQRAADDARMQEIEAWLARMDLDGVPDETTMGTFEG